MKQVLNVQLVIINVVVVTMELLVFYVIMIIETVQMIVTVNLDFMKLIIKANVVLVI